MQDERDVTATKLTFSRIDRDVILGFLTWLETARNVVPVPETSVDGAAFLSGVCGTNGLYPDGVVPFCLQYSLKESHGRIVEF